MSFNEEGYLSDEMNKIAKEIFREYTDYFTACETLNKFAYEVYEMLDIHEAELREIIIVCLMAKIHNAFQGVILSYKYGLDAEAKVILRTALESLFCLRATIRDEKFYSQFIKADDASRQKHLQNIKKYPDVFDSLQDHPSLNVLDDLICENKKNKIHEYSAFDLAEKADMVPLYRYAYSELCDDIHPNIRNLEHRYLITTDTRIQAFNLAPCTNDILRDLSTNNYIMLIAIDDLNSYFHLSIDTEISEFRDEYERTFQNRTPGQVSSELNIGSQAT
jgi:hypothetical protein